METYGLILHMSELYYEKFFNPIPACPDTQISWLLVEVPVSSSKGLKIPDFEK